MTYEDICEVNAEPIPAGLGRRIAALAYDALLLFGLLFFLSIPVVVSFDVRYGEPGYLLYLAYIHAITFVFLGWFWVHQGQTLGMRAWHLHLKPIEGDSMDWKLSLRRYLAALLFWVPGWTVTQLADQGGYTLLGLVPLLIDYGWAFTNPRRLALHDLLSRSRLVIQYPRR